MFYVVSRRKLAILFLSTFMLYAFYWFYKNWSRYKGHHPEACRFGTTVSPAPRAAFWMFFTHALFRKIKQHGMDQPAVARWHSGLHATILVALMLVSSFIDVPIGGKAGDVVSTLSIVPLLFPFLKAQDMINLGCGDPGGKSNDRLSKANKAWMIAGGLLWVLVILGTFILGEG
jgi:hypothetical protein